MWVSLTLAAALAAVTAPERRGLDPFLFAGLGVWVIGFALEAVADWRKSRFRANPANKGAFVNTGLWAISRHSNYLGEIMIWVAVALIAAPVLEGTQYVTLISPLFVYLLITRVSGIPPLEKKADARWGGEPAYEAYKRRTPVLVPFFGTQATLVGQELRGLGRETKARGQQKKLRKSAKHLPASEQCRRGR